MQCLVDPELTSDELSLFHYIYRCASGSLPKDGQLPPAAFFRVGQHVTLPNLKPGQIAAMQLKMSGQDAGKDALSHVLREFARDVDATLCILMLESWMVKPNDAEAAYFRHHGDLPVRPSQHPNRIEIVFFAVSKPGGHNWSASVEIKRDATGVPSIPADPPTLEYLKSEGRFANILDESVSDSSSP